MSNLPPQQPGSLNYLTPQPNLNLRLVAARQRVIMLCILTYIAVFVLQFIVPGSLKIVLALIGLGVSITATVFIFMLATLLYGTGVGVVLGLLTLIPIVGLIILLVVNAKATGILRQAGIQVGLLGADVNSIPSP